MDAVAAGTFEVTLTPRQSDPADGTPAIARMAIDKEFAGAPHGPQHRPDAERARVRARGSAGYVALELVTGTLEGRSGSFLLQHFGLMNRGVPEMKVVVVPDSGTGALSGLAGEMRITIDGAAHGSEFRYALPAAC